MSAVAGIYYLDGRPVDGSLLQRMLASLAHRGSDGAGLWRQGPVGLAHRMLWTTAESRLEDLPVLNRRGDLVLTADVRIDNRDELLGALGSRNVPRAELPDGALILAAYECWGERCPEKLLGDFAFALWDGRREVLFCARDHFGVKPFYYYCSGRAFVFASEIKGLLCLPDVPQRLNETRVAEHLLPLLDDPASTFYRGILRLPPGHSMTVGRQGSRLRAYWSLDSSRTLRLGSDDDYAEAFRELLARAVRCRLRSVFPVGSMLSGGLDSSSVTCLAREFLAQDGDRLLHTFSAIFDEVPECDERAFIRAVVARGPLEAHFVRGDLLSPLAELDRVLWHQDEPFDAPNLFLLWGLYRSANGHGVRVLLEGQDGDSVVSHGISYLAELARRGRWASMIREARGLGRHFHRPWRSVLWRHALRPLVPYRIARAWRALRRPDRVLYRMNPTFNRDFARRIALADHLRAVQGSRPDPPRTAREDHHRRLTRGVIPFALEVADRAAAAFCIEPRYPFFDKQLVEFCLALPPEQKLRDGWTRIVLRRAMARVLPEEVRLRGGKADLAPNFRRALLTFQRERLDDLILNDSASIEAYVDLPALREAYRRLSSRAVNGEELTVWKAVTLAGWLQRTGLRP